MIEWLNGEWQGRGGESKVDETELLLAPLSTYPEQETEPEIVEQRPGAHCFFR